MILDLRGELVHVPLAHSVPPVDRQAARLPRHHALHVERQGAPIVSLLRDHRVKITSKEAFTLVIYLSSA